MTRSPASARAGTADAAELSEADRRGASRGVFEGAVIGSLTTALLGQLALIATGVITARVLGVTGRGQFAAIVLVPSVLSQFGTIGIPLALTYYIAKDLEGGRSLLRSLPVVIGVQVVVLSVVQVGLLWFLLHDDERAAIFAAVLVLPALVAQQYGLGVLQGQRHFTAFNVLRLAPAALLALAVIALAWIGDASLVTVVAAWTIANVLVGVALGATTVRFAGSGERLDSPYGRAGVARFGLNAMVGSGSPTEVLRIDQVLVAFMLSRSALGLYVAALAFTNLPRFISQSVGMVAYPRVAAAEWHSDARALGRRYLLLVALASGTIVALLEVTVPWLIPWFFGQEFAGAVRPAQILLLGSLFLAIRRVLTDIAQGLGHPEKGALAELVSLALTLPLVAVAVPLYGIEGAAAALTIGTAVSLGFLGLSLRRMRKR